MVPLRASVLACGVILLVSLAACSPERQDWRSVEAADTIEAYDGFIARHPQSELAPQARARIAQLAEQRDWERASKADTALAYRQYLNQHPQGQWSHEARIRVESFELGAQSSASKPARNASAAQTSGFAIQLGAFSSEEKARAEWSRIAALFPRELGGLHARTEPSGAGGSTVYRLQASAADEKQARDLCASLKARAQECVVVLPR